jgi:hypothetical protein
MHTLLHDLRYAVRVTYADFLDWREQHVFDRVALFAGRDVDPMLALRHE